jgi:hypothetical protein
MGGTVSGGNANRWSPQDRVRALERLANARANLAGLERRDAPAIDPDIQAAVIDRQQQINQLKTEIGKRGRAGRQARQQVEALLGTQGLVMECLGFNTYEEFLTAIERFDASRIDHRVIDAARDEVDRAERHFFDTAEMKIPVPPQAAAAPAPVAPVRAPVAPVRAPVAPVRAPVASPAPPAPWGAPRPAAPQPKRPARQAPGPRWAAS